MKRNFILVAVLFFVVAATAQKNLPGIGKIDKADLEMKDCDFDKGADALTLIDWGNLYYDRGISEISFMNTIYERRTRIKILKESGLTYANASIPYYDNNNEERILKIDAYTYNLDESGNIKVTEVSKSSIYSKRINKFYSKMIIAFPEVKVGSVIEFKYKMERRTDQNLKDWFFQDKIPVRYSEYQINIPQLYHFSVQPTVVDNIEVKEDVKDDLISTSEGVLNTQVLKKNFIMRNLVGIRSEPFMGSVRDYQQRLEFQLSEIEYSSTNVVKLRTSWADVIKDLMKDGDFGKQLEWESDATATIIGQAKQLPDTESKMKFIYNYVRKNISWDGDESIYSLNGVSNAFSTKTGSSGDINLLLVGLLNKAGVKASPILLSTRENGLVNKFYPFIKQFNTVMAYVKLNDKYFILDGTDKVSGCKLIPESIVNTQGFIVDGDDGKWIELVDQKNKYKVMAAIHGEIDDAGVMKGDGLVNCNGYARKQRCEAWLKNKEQFKDEYFTKPYTALKIDDLAVNNADADSLPLEQKVKFTSVLNSSGNYKYFTVNLFSDLDKNPFLADERMADIDFGFQQDYTVFGNYSIPQDYVFDGLPENISMIMPDTSIIFTRSMQADDNLLNVKISVEFKRSFYTAANYPEFKEFYKKLFAKLNEQIVIKKK
ncbi:DUF3857 and transglutaminase domain-containing protein [Ferruginibacter sp. SUN106]|uniref:DUF3857 and transglutaminase domain-containing protein n=1 Tax=Ferruginibacter sp. SUN106 TaxID=2978348 RepID=UPI003D35CBC3